MFLETRERYVMDALEKVNTRKNTHEDAEKKAVSDDTSEQRKRVTRIEAQVT